MKSKIDREAFKFFRYNVNYIDLKQAIKMVRSGRSLTYSAYIAGKTQRK